MPLDDWKTLFALSDEHGFVIAADECYSEIYFDESDKPLGALQAASLPGAPIFGLLRNGLSDFSVPCSAPVHGQLAPRRPTGAWCRSAGCRCERAGGGSESPRERRSCS